MQNFISREQLTDFLEKMWDAGIRCDLKPGQSSISLWSEDFSKVEYVAVVSQRSYDEMIRGIQCSLLPIDDGMNTMEE